MKKTYTNLMGKLATGVLLVLGVAFVTGCAKDAKQDVNEDTGEGTRVVIRVEGIDNGGAVALKGKAGSATNAASANNAKLVQGDGFDVFVSQSSKIATQSNSVATKRRSVSSSSNGLRAEAMPEGRAYRVFLRKSGETALVSEPFTSGTVGSIPVEKGASYEWFALSFNGTDEVPAGTDGSVAIDDHSGILYAKGEFEVPAGDGDVVVPLNITFKPQLTRVAIEINTMGMFAPIASANISVTGSYSSPESIDIITGDFQGTVTPVSLTADDFEEVVAGQGDRIAHTVNVAANASEDIAVSVTNLVINTDDGNTRNFGSATMTQTFTPEPGMEQQIVLGFVESPLVRSGVSWARSNLYYEAGHNPYRFFHTNSRTNNPNSYFSFKGHLPRRLASSNASQQIDPCALVYPAGLWKTPSQSDLGTLTNTQGLLTNVVGGLLATLGLAATPGVQYERGEYIQMDPTYSSAPTSGQNSAYAQNGSQANVLRFQYNGLRANIGAVQELITLDLGSTYGSQAAFWTNESINDANLGGLLGGTLDLGAWSFVGRDVALLGLLGRRGYATQSLGVLNIDLLGTLNVVNSSLMNVRCVRDASWNPTAPGYDPNPDLSNL